MKKTGRFKRSITTALLPLLFSACIGLQFYRSDQMTRMELPAGFPPVSFPEDNAFTKQRWALGKLLFYDKSLSRDSSVSCASCHLPGFAFSDTTALSKGASDRAGTQNAPTLTNVAYNPYYTRLGGVSTLEKQILVPIQEHNEFDFNILSIAQRLKVNKTYQTLSQQAYGRPLDYYVITRSIANFERTLISGNSPYDRFKNGHKDALNELAQKGMTLFYSEKTNCSLCHGGFNFTNYGFENNGLYEVYKDIGRMRLTEKEEDRSKFKVPTLRNIAVTAPYMHDGSLKTLEEVIEHYNSGGKNNSLKNPVLKPLHLNTEEKQALIAFLKSLTDLTFLSNEKFKFKS